MIMVTISHKGIHTSLGNSFHCHTWNESNPQTVRFRTISCTTSMSSDSLSDTNCNRPHIQKYGKYIPKKWCADFNRISYTESRTKLYKCRRIAAPTVIPGMRVTHPKKCLKLRGQGSSTRVRFHVRFCVQFHSRFAC
jgi:hypothetical protein